MEQLSVLSNASGVDLSGRIALVTGGSRGIGAGTAIRLAASGADVIVNYVSSKSAALEVCAKIARFGRRTALVRADVSEDEDVQELAGFVQREFGRLDILVHNAAAGGFRNLIQTTPRHFELAMGTNVRALISLVQHLSPLMITVGGRSKVVALSSHGSRIALPYYGLVGASKAALESVVRQLALELGDEGINFNVVVAGLVETDSTRALPDAQKRFEEAGRLGLVGDRLLDVHDVAETVLYLASRMSDMVQGQSIIVDGGSSVHRSVGS